jgi:hypothetical protein
MSNQITLQKDPVNQFYRERYVELELEHEPVDDTVIVKHDADTDELVVGYLTHDNDLQWDCWDLPSSVRSEIGDQGLLVEFRSEMERDEYMEEMAKEGEICFVVDKYEHGNVHYSIEATGSYPDRRWDVAPCGVYVLDADTKERLKSGDIDEEQVREITNSLLDNFSDFCNGDGYGCTVEKFEKNEEGDWEQKSEDSCWNFIGRSHAEQSLKEDQLSGFADFPPLKTFENTKSFSI